jgi:DNA invertase Pin-like site-specific DNA recombinase
VALYARISTHDQQTLPLQIKTMREYAVRRGWQIAAEINEVGSGALQRPKSIGRSLTAHNTKWPILCRIVAMECPA